MIKVDNLVIISLQNDQIRQKTVLQEMAKLNLQAQFFLSERDKENGERGCFNSHVSVAKNALYDDCQSLLVFEDDVKILNFTPQQIAAINQFVLKKNKHFDVLYLGIILGKIWFCGSFSIVRARGAGLHAYLLSRRGIEKMSNYQYQGRPIDEVVQHDFKAYSVYPMLAIQYPETETNSTVSGFRNLRKRREPKNHAFWQDNCKKQKRRLWSNFHRTIYDFFLAIFRVFA